MKTLNYIGSLMMTAVLVFTACEPIEDRLELKNSYDPAKIELSAVQATPGSNKVILKMNTKGVAGYWDYMLDKKFSDQVEVIFPFGGELTLDFHATNAYIPNGDLSKSIYPKAFIKVNITNFDHKVADAFYFLVGDDLDSKTWVFDRSNIERWWYMTDESWESFWWQPGVGDCTDADGEMIFDVNGGANYTYVSEPGGTPVKGSKFSFNGDYTKITINGDANILGVMGGGESTTGSKTYDILELTADRMVLFQNPVVWSPGWVWVFKPKN